MKANKLILLIFFSAILKICFSQEIPRTSLKYQLDSLSNTSIPQLAEILDISLSNISLSELVRTISNQINLNINIDPSLDFTVNNNFSQVTAKDVIYMLCVEYDLECSVYGNIINLRVMPETDQTLNVDYDAQNNLLSYDLSNCLLEDFTKEVSEKTGINFFIIGEAGSIRVNGYVNLLDPLDALTGLAESNNFILNQVNGSLFTIEPRIEANQFQGTEFSRDISQVSESININPNGRISVNGNNLSCDQIFQLVASQLNIPYHKITPINATKNISLTDVDFRTFMNALVNGTLQTYKYQDSILYVGERSKAEMKTSRLITFNNRRVDSLIEILPKEIFENIQTKEFPELNGVILVGDADALDQAEVFLRGIDVSIPVVLIDVIIMDVSNTEQLETGIEAGLLQSGQGEETSGTINPGIDYTMGSESVNNAISSLGLTRLGRVTPNFYVRLRALETQGVLDIRSTPQLSTLNGHPASLSIGETQYYVESSSLFQGSLTGQVETSKKYSSVEAQLGVKIEPFVSGNGDVTLNIEVEQSDFTDRFEEGAPPGIISRRFQSMIRVKNEEMILLGGLEEIAKEESNSGLPGISRIPVIGWFFSHRINSNTKSRLNIFIKPTILY